MWLCQEHHGLLQRYRELVVEYDSLMASARTALELHQLQVLQRFVMPEILRDSSAPRGPPSAMCCTRTVM